MRLSKKKTVLAGLALAGAIGFSVQPASAAGGDNHEISGGSQWHQGAIFSKANASDEAKCGSGLWLEDQSVDADWYLALPASCFLESSAALSPLSGRAKFWKLEYSDDDDDWIDYDDFDGTVLRGFNGSGYNTTSWNLVLVKFNEIDAMVSKWTLDWCPSGTMPCAGHPGWAGANPGNSSWGLLEKPTRTNWADANTTLNGTTSCAQNAYSGRECGWTVSNTPSNFTQDTGPISLPDWVTPTITQTNISDPSCGTPKNVPGSIVYLTGSGQGGGAYPGENHKPIGLTLGATSYSNANKASCYLNPAEQRGWDTRYISIREIRQFGSQHGLDLQPVDHFENWGLDDVGGSEVNGTPYEYDANTVHNLGSRSMVNGVSVRCTHTIGNDPISGSTLYCERFQTSNPSVTLSSDTWLLPYYCSDVTWHDGTNAFLNVRHNQFQHDPMYPRVGYNEYSVGCQSNYPHIRAVATTTTSTCRMSPLATSSCVSVYPHQTNNAQLLGSSSGALAVSNFTSGSPGPAECVWPSGCAAHMRIYYMG